MQAKELLKDLVAINTIADKDNNKFIAYVEDYYKKLGFDVRIEKNKETGKEVLIASYGDNPAIGFLGHSDTVAITDGWVTDPHDLIEKDGNLYGLGACDMKGGIAAFMSAMAEVDLKSLKRGIKAYITYDEEIMFDGIKDMVEVETDFPGHLVVAEPTDMVPMVGSKGLLEYIFTFKGVTTHSSTPIDGKSSNKNAVRFLNKMMDLEEELRKTKTEFFDVPYPTMNIGIVEGGTSINKVPDKTTIYLDFRICDSDREYPMIRKAVDDAIEGIDASYEIINDIPSFQNEGDLVKMYEEKTGKESRAFFGITEASFLKGDRVIIGPGPMTAHEKNEHISVDSLEKAKQVFVEMIETLCK